MNIIPIVTNNMPNPINIVGLSPNNIIANIVANKVEVPTNGVDFETPTNLTPV